MKKILPTAAALLLLPLAARAESELSLTLQGGAVKYDQALAAPSEWSSATLGRRAMSAMW